MQSPSQPRHPSQILQDIRSEYEKRNNLTTQAAQKHLSKMCQWKESTWGNLERSTLVSGQEWKDDYTSDMVEGSVIKENSRYQKELIAWERIRDAAAWERIRDAAAEQSDREEYLQQQAREQQAGEQQPDPTPGAPPTEAVMAVMEDNNVVNGDNNGGGRGQDKRKWYWIACLGGCAVLLLLCALGVTTAYLYVQREQLARQTPTPPEVIEKEVTRIVEITRIVEATVVPERAQPGEGSTPPTQLPTEKLTHAERIKLLAPVFWEQGVDAWLKEAGYTWDSLRVAARQPQEEILDGKLWPSGIQVEVTNLNAPWPSGLTTDRDVSGRCIQPDPNNPSKVCTDVIAFSGTATLWVDVSNWGQLSPHAD